MLSQRPSGNSLKLQDRAMEMENGNGKVWDSKCDCAGADHKRKHILSEGMHNYQLPYAQIDEDKVDK